MRRPSLSATPLLPVAEECRTGFVQLTGIWIIFMRMDGAIISYAER